jgi:hypothetical protein
VKEVRPEIAKIGSHDTPLVFFIRIWLGSMGLNVFRESFGVLDEPRMPFEIRWWSG